MGEVSVLDTRPSSSVNIFPETSRMDLHPACGSYLQELYRHTLLVRPHAHEARDDTDLEETTVPGQLGPGAGSCCGTERKVQHLLGFLPPRPPLSYGCVPDPEALPGQHQTQLLLQD